MNMHSHMQTYNEPARMQLQSCPYPSCFAVSRALIAPVRCPVTSPELFVAINQLATQVLAARLLVGRQRPIGWAAVRRNRDE